MGSTETLSPILGAIRAENLAVYRASPQRLREDVGQEAQIAQDYRGRLIYELLQNADDAMRDSPGGRAAMRFTLLPDSLWVANSGRSLDEADIRGLCGVGASSKGVAGRRRASIGHKGMGFKSVLEITDSPEAHSTCGSLRFGPEESLRAVRRNGEGVLAEATAAPVCRFPWPAPGPEEWAQLREVGFRTAFRFPLRARDAVGLGGQLEAALRSLPLTSLLFLKHMRRVEIEFRLGAGAERTGWTIERARQDEDGGWAAVDGFDRPGLYQVVMAPDAGESESFLLAHDCEIPIGPHRGTLNAFSWEGVDWTEVSVAARLGGAAAVPLPDEWRRLHVFLPSEEPCPYHLIVSGAFNANLSRQEIRVEPGEENYNRFLIGEAARLFRAVLLPGLLQSGSSALDLLALLDRGVPPGTPSPSAAAQALYEKVRAEISRCVFVDAEGDRPLSVAECVLPPLVPDSVLGRDFRELLAPGVAHGGKRLPAASLCGAVPARVLADHGASLLSASEAAALLAQADPSRSGLREHASGGLNVDPVLAVLERLWEGLGAEGKAELCGAARAEPLFSVGLRAGGQVHRVATQDLVCFYPPRSLRGEVPLGGLCFLMQELCWGAMNPAERNAALKREMAAWQAIFDIKEFKFPDVMRASVLPALELDGEASARGARPALQRLDLLAAICQLSGRMPDRTRPLPYERLGPNRALFNLSRLDVPCRGARPGEVEWVPAYRAYLGADWVGEDSVEVIRAAWDGDIGGGRVAVHFLVGPTEFAGLLDQYRHLKEVAAEDGELGEDEVRIDEDEETALDADEKGRWLGFFLWLGVNQALRPVHFHDVEDRASGWLKTAGFQRPEGWAFRRIPEATWAEYVAGVRGNLLEWDSECLDTCVPYFYRIHDLEHLAPLLRAAASDTSGETGRRLYEHLARNWSILERFWLAEVALVDQAEAPNRRTKPPRARDGELYTVEADFWMFRLRNAAFCPTGQGPRQADATWLPTLEVQRRFGRRGRAGMGYLVPTLEVSPSLPKAKGKAFALALGMREELTAAAFTLADSRLLLDRIRDLYAGRVAEGADLRSDLRETIRPAYRHLLELLSAKDRPAEQDGVDAPLRDAPVLAHDGLGNFSFRQAGDVYFIDRQETRDRLQATEPIWSFVLESSRAARTTLVQVFGMRVLEDELRWSPKAGDPALDGPALVEWRSRLRDLAPYVLARVGADRTEEAQARQDARSLRRLIELMEPVTGLELCCELDGRQVGSAGAEREAFVESRGGDPALAFIRWGQAAWPPSDDEGEALAVAFGDVLGPGYFEPFLALAKAPTPSARERLLRRAGAPLDLEERRLLFAGEQEAATEAAFDAWPEERRTAAPPPAEEVPPGPADDPASQRPGHRVPLLAIDRLLVQGEPVRVLGDPGGPPRQAARPESASGEGVSCGASGGGSYGGHTDLPALDRLGMAVVLAYEVSRLRKAGAAQAAAFDPTNRSPQPDAMVFDVSQPWGLALARALCPPCDAALRALEALGVSGEWPGFDVLSLDPAPGRGYGRLIELKSSGVCSRVQEMSWNEWKTACASTLRQSFYLYLVGNLRSDLNGAKPFIRTIRNPFEQLTADVRVGRRTERKVQLAVHQFREAEHLDLTVVPGAEGGAE